MIATIEGQISDKELDYTLVVARGIGYKVYATHEDLSHVQNDEKHKFFIYEYIREQAYDLYGFLSKDTKQLFEQLLAVNGVGPRMALSMLSIGSVSEVKRSITTGDLAYIQRASGVGRRLAERVVVELKDKLGLVPNDLDMSNILSSSTALVNDEAVEALMSLGYTANDATKALKDIDPKLITEERVKQALKGTT